MFLNFDVKKSLILLNAVFLLVGNLLFSSIHLIHDHTHNDLHYECEECVIHKISENCVIDLQDFFSNITFNSKVEFKGFRFLSYEIQRIANQRAPPFSC